MNPSLGVALFSVKSFRYLIDQSITKTVSSVLTGTQPLIKNGAGTLILSGSNAYSGGTFAKIGTLQATSATALGTGTVQVDAGATVQVSVGGTVIANAFTGAGTLTCDTLGSGSTTTELSGDLSGFVGTFNIGPSGGKLFLSGIPPASDAVINVLSGATIDCSSFTYGSALTLAGGTIGEAIGQLRMDGGTWSGPITLTAASSIGTNTAGTATISGVISGAFDLSKQGGGTTILTADCTVSGVVTVSAGTLQLGNNGTTGGIASASSISLTGALVVKRTNTLSLSQAISGAGNITMSGTGTLDLSGTSTRTGDIFAYGGTTKLSGGAMSMSTKWVYIDGQNGNARFDITSGTHNILAVHVGTATTTTSAAVYQSGGSLTGTQVGTTGYSIGYTASCYGYWNLSGGSISCYELCVGGLANATVGVMDISGGTLTVTQAGDGYICVGRGGTTSSGSLNVTGGTVTALRIENDWAASSGAQSTVSVSGTGSITTQPSATLGLNLSAANGTGTWSTFNVLTGGTFTTGIITSGNANPSGHFNFNGGTVVAQSTNAGASFMTSGNIDAVNVFPGGGTLNNNGTNITVSRPLIVPPGYGVSSVTFTGGSGYGGAPLVKFSGGTGVCATGYAVMSGGSVQSIVITSPGTGYGSGDTVTCTFVGGGPSVAASASAVTLAANTSGGMTFTGSGTTILSGASTYTGTTTISAGTVRLSGSLASGSAVTVSGGNLQGTGTAAGSITVANVASSSIQGGTGAGTTTTLSCGALTFSGSTAALNVTSNGTTACSLVASTGAVTLGGATVNLLGALNAGTYNLITATSMSGTVSVGTNSTGRTVSSCAIVGNNLVLVLV